MSAGPSQSKAGKDVNLDGEKGTLPAEVECEESTRKRPVKQDTCSSACGDAQLSAQDSKSSPGEGEEPCRTSHANSLVSRKPAMAHMPISTALGTATDAFAWFYRSTRGLLPLLGWPCHSAPWRPTGGWTHTRAS